MRPQDQGLGGAELVPLEQVLSEAATWEPDVPAPAGLAARAMAAELERQDRDRTLRGQERRAGLFTAFFMGASAVSATVAFAFFHWSPSSPQAVGTPATESATSTTIVAKVLPREDTLPETGIVSRAGTAAPLPRPRRIARTAAPRRRVKKAAEAPVARWHEETVRHEVAGVLSSGWLIRQNPEDGSYIVTPGVLDVQAVPQDACGESPAPAGEAPAVPQEPAAETPNTPGVTPLSSEENEVPPAPES